MLIYFSSMQLMEESRLPSLFKIHGYAVFFWSNENDEPIHVHVAKGTPTPNSTKLWLTKDGGCIIANNNSNIPTHVLNELMQIIGTQSFLIIEKWMSFFKTKSIKFYC